MVGQQELSQATEFGLAISPVILAEGFKARYQERTVHLRGVSPDPRIIENYLAALRLRTPGGALVVPPVYRVYAPLTALDLPATMAKREILLETKDESRLPAATINLLGRASKEGLFELVFLQEAESYLQAAMELGMNETNFTDTMTQTSLLIFVSEWVGPNLVDFITQKRRSGRQLKKLGGLLGETLAILHRGGLIAGDTHLKQFVLREKPQEVLRVDLVNIYSLKEVSADNILTEYWGILSELSLYSSEAAGSFIAAYKKDQSPKR